MQRIILIICVILSVVAPSIILPDMKGGSKKKEQRVETSRIRESSHRFC